MAKVTDRPVLDRICSAPYRQTAHDEPFKPGDEVQFRVDTLAGHGYFLGQVWSFAPAHTTYWIATDSGVFHQVRRSDLRLIHARGEASDFVVEVA